ncbi:unnamed protein product [Toxocara canis]|uniref:Twinfilin-1 n=1 Tax=Toxocara canis TaxID=6265 RepID=A0A183U6N7_TOXCA|nr:unnamed protein product [Toxocara canis]
MLEDSKDIAELPPLKLERIDEGIPERDSYEALCRGEQEASIFSVNIAEQSKVYCYLKMDRMFLKLAPIKVEILRFDPLVVLFKQIISDYEIEIVEKLATPRVCHFSHL